MKQYTAILNTGHFPRGQRKIPNENTFFSKQKVEMFTSYKVENKGKKLVLKYYPLATIVADSTGREFNSNVLCVRPSYILP